MVTIIQMLYETFENKNVLHNGNLSTNVKAVNYSGKDLLETILTFIIIFIIE